MRAFDRLSTKILIATVSVTFAMALSSLLGEALVRHRERSRTTVPGSITMLYYQHKRLGHGLVRNTDYFGWMRINRHGFRGPDMPIQKPAATHRIMVIGGSTTFDTQVSSDERTWPARLQYWLNHGDRGFPVEIVNAGVPGYRVIDHVIRLQTDLYRFQPDLIILYAGHNDISCALRDNRTPPRERANRPNEIPVVTPWSHWLQTRSLLYHKVIARWRATRQVANIAGLEADDAEWIDVPPCTPGKFRRDLRAFLSLAEQFGLPVVIPEVVHASGFETTVEQDSTLRANWLRTRPYADPDDGLRLYREYSTIARQATEEFGIPFISTRDFHITGIDLYGRSDPMHFNDDGAEQMARHLADALLDVGVLRRR